MSTRIAQLGNAFWRRARDVAVALIAACWPGRDFHDIDARLDGAQPATQRGIVFCTLAALFAMSLVAAQFGLLGLCIYWLAIIWIIR